MQTRWVAVLYGALLAGGRVMGADADDALPKLALKTHNPVADMTCLPFNSTLDFGLGANHAVNYTVNVQPLLPIRISPEHYIVSRTSLPLTYAQTLTAGGGDHSGLGDVQQSFFWVPKGAATWGFGPFLQLPTATDRTLGMGKWCAGPTAAILKQEHGWTFGALVWQAWSFAGAEDRPAFNQTYVNPFLSYTTPGCTTFGISGEATRDWEADTWLVPVNFTISHLVKLGDQKVSLTLGWHNYVVTPAGGPDWGLKLGIAFLFPE
jgi:hypothetical protein